jgi:hypothetical protein
MANKNKDGYSLRRFWNDATSINALPRTFVKGLISAFRKDPNNGKIDWDKELARRNSKSEWVNFAEDFASDAGRRSVDVLSNFGKGMVDGLGGLGHGVLALGSAASQLLPGKYIRHGAGRLFQKGHNYVAEGVKYAHKPFNWAINADGQDLNNDNEMARSANGAVRLSGSLLSSLGAGGKLVGGLGKVKNLGATATSARGAAALNKFTQLGAKYAPKVFTPNTVSRVNDVGGKLIRGASNAAFVNGNAAATGYFTLSTMPMLSDALNTLVDQDAINKHWYTRAPKKFMDWSTKWIRKPLIGGKYALSDLAKLTAPYHVSNLISSDKWGMAGLQAVSPLLSDPEKYGAGNWLNPKLHRFPVIRDYMDLVSSKFSNWGSDAAYLLTHGKQNMPNWMRRRINQGISAADNKLWDLYNDPNTPITTKLMIESLMYKSNKDFHTQMSLVMPQMVRALKPTTPLAKRNQQAAAEAYDHFKRKVGWK